MYIKDIVLEGFKSYAEQTTISGFDPHFNSITGLNGSGKSNILDAICFVLGIANLSQVRATNLQELIYKLGNAGITKATVSILFDNSDKSQCPPGYVDYDEITVTRQIFVGGKYKYLINGTNATNERVCNLFCSVKLNVNNPNFLIMQGKITKVLNMKPIEILSMIEEAAGTKMYDVKKQNALQTIEKKNAKLGEIERLLKEDITPMIEKLKQERFAYTEYQKIEREYHHLHKISMAYQYFMCEETLSKAQSDSEKFVVDIENNRNRIRTIDDTVLGLKEEIKEMQKEKDSNSQLRDLETNLKEIQKDEAKLNSEEDNINSIIKSENKRRKEIEKMIHDNKELIKSKEKKLNELKNLNEETQTEYMKAESELKNAQKLYEALCCGLTANEDGTLATLQDQLMNTRSKISELQTSIKEAEMKYKHAEGELKKLNKEIGASTKDYDDKLKTFDQLKQSFEKIKNEIEKLNFDTQLLDKLNLDVRRLKNEVYNLNEKVQSFYTKFPQLNFEYKDPERNFDRNRVKGLVCNLFKIKDPKFATALEVAAGGKLYNLVVDTEDTGKLLLKSGDLKRRVTIIPMNKIKAHVIDDHIVRKAKSVVGNENVFTALSLVDYDPVYKTVMEFVFGSRFVCTTTEAAKEVTYHRQILTGAVTLDGDSFDPDGIVTGGSRQDRASVLMKLNELHNDMKELEVKKQEIINVENRIQQTKTESVKYNNLKREYDQQNNQLNAAKIALEQNSHHQKLEKLKSLETEIGERKDHIEKTNDEIKSLQKKQVELEDKLNNQDSNKEKDKKQAQEKIKSTKSFIDKHSKSSQEFQKEYEAIKLEIDVLNKEILNYNDELSKIDENIEKQKEKIEELKEKINEIKERIDEKLGEIHKQKEVINAKNRNISQKSDECDNLQREKNSLELKIKELEHKKTNLSEQLANAQEKLEELLEAHAWIADEKGQFGLPGSIYDFRKQNMKEVQHRLHDMKNRKEKLSKQVDVRAMGLLAKKEEEYEDLTKKRQIVLRDRATLESTIEEVEHKKIEHLKNAYEIINKELGSIFNTLLPGAYAKLELCNKQSILDGVEFKVAFGDAWKESLTELSGGQRSLVALSLILSLLKYKPSPLYILDEVDAALDSSHTQNIGQMIKKHFTNSQFIIVSLKDGMFQNANVLFKTKLENGKSLVQRYTQKKSSNKENNVR